mgnify:FL=1
MREQLTFKVEFVSELDEKNNRDFIFRQMKMKDVRKWSALQREDYKGDKMEDVVSLLRETVVNVKQKEFTSWLDSLYEDEFVSFLETFTEAKEEERKK